MDYNERDLLKINEAKQQASFMFVGGGDVVPIPVYDKVGWQVSESDGVLKYYGEQTISQLINAYAWGDCRNWVRLEGGEPVQEENYSLPSYSDHVVVAAPVAVGGNYRIEGIPLEGGGVGHPDNADKGPNTKGLGEIQERKEFIIFLGSSVDSRIVYGADEIDNPDYNQWAMDLGWMAPVYGPPPLFELIGYEPYYSGTYEYYQHRAGGAVDPACASATFIGGSFICVDQRYYVGASPTSSGTDMGGTTINFPCYFFENSCIRTKVPDVVTKHWYSDPDVEFTTGQSDVLCFKQPLHFYGNSFIEMSKGAVHYASSPEIYGNGLPENILYGMVGGVVFDTDLHFYGARRIFVTHNKQTKKVYFHDETEYVGGCVTKAEFKDRSIRQNGLALVDTGLDFFSCGPVINPLGSVLFSGQSVNQWPLYCPAVFEDDSRCEIPFFNTTTFRGSSVYEWLFFWLREESDFWFSRSLRNVGFTENELYPYEAHATFEENSSIINSKILCLSPTRFFDDAKLYTGHMNYDGCGHLPSNFSGSFIHSPIGLKFAHIGNGIGGSNSDIYPDSLTHEGGFNETGEQFESFHYCGHLHRKDGPRVPLINGESALESHIVSNSRLIYAEFRDNNNNGDWGDRENWFRIGGDSYMLPTSNTIVRIASGCHVIANSGPKAICAGLIINEDASFNIPMGGRQIAVFNYGAIRGTFEEIGDLYMFGFSINVGRIKQANSTFFCDQARNYGEGKDGFIRSGHLIVISPRTVDYGIDTIGGEVQANMPEYPSEWNIFFGDWSLFVGNIKPTPESYFNNQLDLCFGRRLYGTD